MWRIAEQSGRIAQTPVFIQYINIRKNEKIFHFNPTVVLVLFVQCLEVLQGEYKLKKCIISM